MSERGGGSDRQAGRTRRRTAGATRRAVLVGAGVGALAGCVSYGESAQFRAFERRVRDRGIRVKRVAEDYRRWILEYYPEGLTGAAFREELETVAAVYAETVPTPDESESHRSLKGILFDDRTNRVGSYEIPAEWARARRAGSLSSEDYVERVRETRTA
jgi:hypothetical protein